MLDTAPRRVITPLMRLQDAAYTKIILVTLPEVTPVSQAAALQADRELLYSGLTRARRCVQVMSTEQALRAAIGRPTRRHTGLISRLQDGPA